MVEICETCARAKPALSEKKPALSAVEGSNGRVSVEMKKGRPCGYRPLRRRGGEVGFNF